MLDFIFRTDASVDIGTGHVMRCLTVAEMLRNGGSVCKFICRDFTGNLIDLIRFRGFEVHVLEVAKDRIIVGNGDNVPHAEWLGVGWREDAQQTQSAVSMMTQTGRAAWMVADHYALDKRWEIAVSGSYRRLLIIDDLADRSHHCDVLLDQNIGRQEADYDSLTNLGCERLTGTRYALLRPEFAAVRTASLARRAGSSVEKLLISLGGIDKDNATAVVLAGLLHCDLPADLEITVVMGEHAPWLGQVREQAERMRWKTIVATNVTNMAEHMAAADIAIGAAGSTTWERFCLGLPTLLIGIAANQFFILAELAREDLAVVGNINELSKRPALMRSLMTQLVNRRTELSRSVAKIVDGQGCNRLIGRLMDRR